MRLDRWGIEGRRLPEPALPPRLAPRVENAGGGWAAAVLLLEHDVETLTPQDRARIAERLELLEAATTGAVQERRRGETGETTMHRALLLEGLHLLVEAVLRTEHGGFGERAQDYAERVRGSFSRPSNIVSDPPRAG